MKRRGTALSGRYDLLAVDPGTCTGWAVFRGSSLFGCGIGDPPVEDCERVVIELPQVYPSHPVPPNDLITLAFMSGRYAGRAAGEVSTVLPHQWKGNLPKDVCAARVRTQLSPHEQQIVDECGATKKQLHNVMDAIGIGLFFLDQHCDRRQTGANAG